MQVLLERYTGSGKLDSSFGGGDGFVLTDFGLVPAEPGLPPTVFSRFAILDGSDRIVISGTGSAGTVPSKTGFLARGREAYIARLTPDGEEDRSFATNGVLPMPGSSFIGEPAVDKHGGVFFSSRHGYDDVLIHLGASGQDDPEFGGNGARPRPRGTESLLMDPIGRVLLFGRLLGIDISTGPTVDA